MIYLSLLACLVLAALIWIRAAPSPIARFHVTLSTPENRDFTGGVKRAIPASDATLNALDAAALASPRTKVLAGSAQDGHVTYITRSALFGFPDYTTVQRIEGQLLLWGRLRFGIDDLGVNKARVDGWLARLPKD